MSLFKPTLAIALLSSDINYKIRHDHPNFGKRHKKDYDIIHTLTPKAWSFSLKNPNYHYNIFATAIIFFLSLEIIIIPSKKTNIFACIIVIVTIWIMQMIQMEYLSLPQNPERILKIERMVLKHASIRNGILNAKYNTRRVDVHFKEIVDDGLYIKVRDLLVDEGIEIIAVGECQFKTGSERIHEKKYPIVNLQLPGGINRTYIGLSTYSYLSLLDNINELTRLNDRNPTGHSQWISYSLDEKTGKWKREWVRQEDDSIDNWWNHIYEKV